ncbi:hypothetical protein [Desmonostoc muscorum]|nr:hypothetical protein [Desmonostoc muscorum]
MLIQLSLGDRLHLSLGVLGEFIWFPHYFLRLCARQKKDDD